MYQMYHGGSIDEHPNQPDCINGIKKRRGKRNDTRNTLSIFGKNGFSIAKRTPSIPRTGDLRVKYSGCRTE